MKRIALVIVFLLVLSCRFFIFSQDNKNRREFVVIGEQAAPEMSMWVANNTLHIKNAPVGKRVEIITIIGNKIREILITSPEFDYELNLPRAIYIFRMDDGTVKRFINK